MNILINTNKFIVYKNYFFGHGSRNMVINS